MSSSKLSPEVEKLVLTLLEPLEVACNTALAFGIVAEALTHIGIPARALKCVIVLRENAANPVLDALEINDLVIGINGGKAIYGWDEVIFTSSYGGAVRRDISPYDLDSLMRSHTNLTGKPDNLLEQSKATAQAVQLDQETRTASARATRRVGL